jgi:quercetin dioxygenase-like cupin family protein
MAMKPVLIAVVFAALGAASPVQEGPILILPADVKWADAPESLPPGSSICVLQGDPAKEGMFTLRLKFPADYRVPPHTHPTSEAVTVLGGTLFMSMGDKFDASKAKGMAAGSFIGIPRKISHFAYTREETIIQISGMGPFELNYVNPAEDPRNKR